MPIVDSFDSDFRCFIYTLEENEREKEFNEHTVYVLNSVSIQSSIEKLSK